MRLTGETVDPAKVQEYVKRAIDRAVKLGSRVIVFGSSGAKNVPEGFPYDRAFGQIADVLRMIDTYAASAGIHIAIEPLNRQESNIIQNLEEGKKLMTEAGGPSIRLLADYYHFMLEKESLETLKKGYLILCMFILRIPTDGASRKKAVRNMKISLQC